MTRPYPDSLGIGGAWGYIGRKFLSAALHRRIRTFVLDPAAAPADVDLSAVTQIHDDEQFYRLPVDMFHLGMHPDHRQRALELLLSRRDDSPVAILNEKPMAAPEHPQHCQELIDAVGQAGALMLFDFPELFDPLTERVVDYLTRFRDCRISDLYVRRSKDRENPDNPRNYKRMVPIQYQESVHCLAFVLFLLGRIRGDLESVFDHGVTISGEARPYAPPNPEIYSYVVDGKCSYRATLGAVRVEGLTDFTSGAEAMKERIIVGTGDGRPFHIELDFQEGRKRLNINGIDQSGDPAADSYDHVLRTYTRWRRSATCDQLMSGIYPHPAFARITYQLSSVLWRCCRSGQPIRLGSLQELLALDAGFSQAVPTFERYS